MWNMGGKRRITSFSINFELKKKKKVKKTTAFITVDSQKQTKYLGRKIVLTILTFRVSLFASGRRITKRFKACSCCFLVGRSASKAQGPQYFEIVICTFQKAWFLSWNLLQNAECIHMANYHSMTKDWQILVFWHSFPNVLLGFSWCVTQQSPGNVF